MSYLLDYDYDCESPNETLRRFSIYRLSDKNIEFRLAAFENDFSEDQEKMIESVMLDIREEMTQGFNQYE